MGVRLLLLWRRTREMPELALGLSNAATLFLAFFAPRRYHDWLIRRAQ